MFLPSSSCGLSLTAAFFSSPLLLLFYSCAHYSCFFRGLLWYCHTVGEERSLFLPWFLLKTGVLLYRKRCRFFRHKWAVFLEILKKRKRNLLIKILISRFLVRSAERKRFLFFHTVLRNFSPEKFFLSEILCARHFSPVLDGKDASGNRIAGSGCGNPCQRA